MTHKGFLAGLLIGLWCGFAIGLLPIAGLIGGIGWFEVAMGVAAVGTASLFRFGVQSRRDQTAAAERCERIARWEAK